MLTQAQSHSPQACYWAKVDSIRLRKL